MTQSPKDPTEMVDVRPPAWFMAFQREMGQLLRTPLDMSIGRFRAPVESYSQTLVADVHNDVPGALARLELYHEQYWRRLFNTLQEAFPRTARALGYFWFNALASHFLVAHPPQSFDLANAREGFFSWMIRALDEMRPHGKTEDVPGAYRVIETSLQAMPQVGPRSSAAAVLGSVPVPWSLVVQALHVDEAERRAFRASWEPAWNPTAEQRASLYDIRLRYASSFSLLRLDYDLPVGRLSEDMAVSLERRGTPMHVVILRSQRGIAMHPVDPIFARLLALARVSRLGEAVVRTEKALTSTLCEHLRRSMQAYIETCLANGFWIGAAT